MLYLLPLWVFAPRLVASDPETRSLAMAGLLLPVAFIDFGMSHPFLAYPVGILVYGGWLALLLGWVGEDTARSTRPKPNLISNEAQPI